MVRRYLNPIPVRRGFLLTRRTGGCGVVAHIWRFRNSLPSAQSKGGNYKCQRQELLTLLTAVQVTTNDWFAFACLSLGSKSLKPSTEMPTCGKAHSWLYQQRPRTLYCLRRSGPPAGGERPVCPHILSVPTFSPTFSQLSISRQLDQLTLS